MSNTYRLPYSIHCEKGNLAFHDGIRFDSEITINESSDLEEVKKFFIKLFHRSGDLTDDLVIEKTDKIVLKWTMRYGKLSPRKCFCELEQIH